MTSTACLLETCRGVKASGCPQALPLSEAFVTALTQLVAHAPMPPTTPGQPLRHHAGFRLALCACPNGCARPQVADLGLTAAVSIAVSISQCTGCGCCVAACPDAAITLQNDVAVIDAHRCLGCGACHRVCPSKALTAGPVTLRAFLGGRLGRRPRLGAEINPWLAPDAGLRLVHRCLDANARQRKSGQRFADVIFADGLPGLPAWVLA